MVGDDGTARPEEVTGVLCGNSVPGRERAETRVRVKDEKGKVRNWYSTLTSYQLYGPAVRSARESRDPGKRNEQWRTANNNSKVRYGVVLAERR